MAATHATLPTNDVLATMDLATLAALYTSHLSGGLPRGATTGSLRRMLACLRDTGSPYPKVASKATPATTALDRSTSHRTPDAVDGLAERGTKLPQPAMTEGTVSKPVQDGQGATRLYAHNADHTSYQPATLAQWLGAMSALVTTVADFKALEDAARSIMGRLAAPVPPVAPKAAPAPASKPAPVPQPAAQKPVATAAQKPVPVATAPQAAAKTVAAPVAKPTPVPVVDRTVQALDLMNVGTLSALAAACGLMGLTVNTKCGKTMRDALNAAFKPAPVAAPKAKAAAPVVHPAGTLLIADGKGGVRVATAVEIMAALDFLTGK